MIKYKTTIFAFQYTEMSHGGGGVKDVVQHVVKVKTECKRYVNFLLVVDFTALYSLDFYGNVECTRVAQRLGTEEP